MDNDVIIVKEVIAGSINQYKILVEKYQQSVFRVVLKIVGNNEDAKEVTQRVFVKAYESLNQYKVEYKFFSWIYRIAINSALMFVKQNKRFSSINDFPNFVERISENKINHEIQDRLLNQSINELPEKYKSIILMKYYTDQSYTEISETLGIDEKRVKSRLFDARKLLKNKLLKADFFDSVQQSN